MPVSIVYKNCQRVYLQKAVKIEGINQQGPQPMLVHKHLPLATCTHLLRPKILKVDPLPTIYLDFVTIDQLVNGCKKVGPGWEANVLPLLNPVGKQKKGKMLTKGRVQVFALG